MGFAITVHHFLRPRALARPVLALTLCLLLGSAMAHDTWFASRGQRTSGDQFVSLGTGNVFPVFDSPVGAEHLQRHGCREAGQPLALRPVAQGSTSLILRTRSGGRATLSCWAQLQPSEIELPLALVPVYFAEAQPPAAVLEAWAAMSARGLPWKERYTKHARIVFSGAAADAADPTGAAHAEPGDMGMDMVLLNGQAAVRAGDTVDVQVLRDARPLADFAVELRHTAIGNTSSTGQWHRTDKQGRVRLAVPAAGQWLLRGIDIRQSGSVADSWDTRFVTLAFDVGGPAAR